MTSTSVLRRTAQAVLAVLLGVLALGWFASRADAHDFESSYLYVDVSETELAGQAELPFKSMREVLGLELEGTEDDKLAELESRIDELHAFLGIHTAIGADGQVWDVDYDGFGLVQGTIFGDSGYAYFPYVATVPLAEVPQVLDFRFDPFLDELPERTNLVLLRNDLNRGVIEEEGNALVSIDADNRSVTVDLGDTSQWKNFTGSISAGIDHIRTGPDHILFIMVLLLPSVLVFSNGWRPAPTFGAALWRVLKVVTMFTIAHSITFSLAGLDLIPLPPSQLVEVVIALSIAAAAFHNLRPIMREREWIIAFAFGLFHGLGFAGLIEGLDVSRTTQLVSLLGRNVGIEIGQVVIVLVAFPTLFLLRRTVYYQPIFVFSSWTLAAISGWWVVERVAGFDVGVTDQLVRVFRWPRSLYLAIVVTAIAWFIHERERRADRLLPLHYDELGNPVTDDLGSGVNDHDLEVSVAPGDGDGQTPVG